MPPWGGQRVVYTANCKLGGCWLCPLGKVFIRKTLVGASKCIATTKQNQPCTCSCKKSVEFSLCSFYPNINSQALGTQTCTSKSSFVHCIPLALLITWQSLLISVMGREVKWDGRNHKTKKLYWVISWRVSRMEIIATISRKSKAGE